MFSHIVFPPYSIVRVRINADALTVVHSQQLFQFLPVGAMDGEALLVYVFLNVAEVSIDVALDLAAYAQDDVKLTGRCRHYLYAVEMFYVLLQQTPYGGAALFLKTVAVKAFIVFKRLQLDRLDYLRFEISRSNEK